MQLDAPFQPQFILNPYDRRLLANFRRCRLQGAAGQIQRLIIWGPMICPNHVLLSDDDYRKGANHDGCIANATL
jgi:hypothetical protein